MQPKGDFFFRKCDSIIKSPDLQKKSILTYYVVYRLHWACVLRQSVRKIINCTWCAFLACFHALFPYLFIFALALLLKLFAFLSWDVVLALLYASLLGPFVFTAAQIAKVLAHLHTIKVILAPGFRCALLIAFVQGPFVITFTCC